MTSVLPLGVLTARVFATGGLPAAVLSATVIPEDLPFFLAIQSHFRFVSPKSRQNRRSGVVSTVRRQTLTIRDTVGPGSGRRVLRPNRALSSIPQIEGQ